MSVIDIKASRSFNATLLKALGLSNQCVLSLQVKCELSQPPVVVIERRLSTEECAAFVKYFNIASDSE